MKQITGKQLFGLVTLFFVLAGVFYRFQLLSSKVILALFWVYGGLIAAPLLIKLAEGIADAYITIHGKFCPEPKKLETSEVNENGTNK